MSEEKRLERLLDLLDHGGTDTIGTSVRLPVALRDATSVANELGLVATTTELTVQGLRDALEAFAQRAVLDAHYRAYPEARPALPEIALAAAEIDGHPLSARPDLIERAAHEIGTVRDHPSPDDVLVYAAGLAAAAA